MKFYTNKLYMYMEEKSKQRKKSSNSGNQITFLFFLVFVSRCSEVESELTPFPTSLIVNLCLTTI